MGCISVSVENCNPYPAAAALRKGKGAARTIHEEKVGNCILGYRAVKAKAHHSKWSHFKGRLRDIETLIKARHGNVVPDTDDAFIYAEVISNLAYVEFGEDFVGMVEGWCARWMPWASRLAIEEVIYERTKVRFAPLTADALGHHLRLSYEERSTLNIRTIGAHDVTKRQRMQMQKQLRRARDQERKERERRAAGAISRAEFLANSLTQKQPWCAFGISRRTWERRGKPMPEVSHSGVGIPPV